MNTQQLIENLREDEIITAFTGYMITWKGDRENDKRIMLSIKEGLEVMKQWAQGERVIFLRGGAYATQMISAVEPIKARWCKEWAKLGYMPSNSSYCRGLPEMIESGEAILESDAKENFRNSLNGNTKQLT